MGFNGLNPEQEAAVQHLEGPLLVLAGAGSGKTRVVTQRIIHLIEQGVPPYKILGITFTNKAAQEMRLRVEKLTHARILISTFHSLGARIMRESIGALGYPNNYTIYDEDDAEKLLKACMKDLGIPDKEVKPKALKGMISDAKNHLISPQDCSGREARTATERVFPKVYGLYQERLQSSGALDFDDLIYLTVRLFREHPDVLKRYQERWDYMLVDEYQDTNGSQYEMVSLLTGSKGNLCVVGDPDQSIYSWRGAQVQNILNFSSDYPGAKVVRLEQNYRSTENILKAANSVIEHNDNRYEKNLWSDLGTGEKVVLTSLHSARDEATFVMDKVLELQDKGYEPGSMAVFYRTNFQSRAIEDEALRRRLPYVIVGGISFYQRKEIKDILSYLRMVQSDCDQVAFSRTINLPKRGLGPTTVDKLLSASRQNNFPIFTLCQRALEDASLISLSKKQKTALAEYVQLILDARKEERLDDMLNHIIKKSGYADFLKLDPESYEDRKENLGEFLSKAKEWQEREERNTLEGFLEELSLNSSLDQEEVGENRLHLMTIHNSKGLEFDVVFIVGMEEDLLPHANSRGDFKALEEERRLCYVGMTRARKKLFMSRAQERQIWGSYRSMRRSRFLKEIDPRYTSSLGIEESRPGDEWNVDTFLQQTKTEKTQGSDFEPGQIVMHQQYGIGTVTKTYEGSLGLTYEIHFQNENDKRHIVAKYAKLAAL